MNSPPSVNMVTLRRGGSVVLRKQRERERENALIVRTYCVDLAKIPYSTIIQEDQGDRIWELDGRRLALMAGVGFFMLCRPNSHLGLPPDHPVNEL